MKAGFSIKLILYFAPNCPQQIVAPNCPTPNCPRRIVRAELSAPNCPRRIVRTPYEHTMLFRRSRPLYGLCCSAEIYPRCCSTEIYTGDAVLHEYTIMCDAVLLEYIRRLATPGPGDPWEWRLQTYRNGEVLHQNQDHVTFCRK